MFFTCKLFMYIVQYTCDVHWKCRIYLVQKNAWCHINFSDPFLKQLKGVGGMDERGWGISGVLTKRDGSAVISI